ncbi:type II toxin-antitoxin system Phd/YefM family antitoxin [Microbacterium sp. A82]|uniref:type II toxin-antitoxin system Phd/YefM family antitoxin n=1 Tax=Microbacterium sp. A82 TaxID=3450452 RepID=UPI003F3883D6
MEVISVADARSGLSALIAGFREAPDAAPVTVGSHRRPEVVLLSLETYRRLTAQSEPVVSLERLRQLKPVIERLAHAARLELVQVYGSVARGEQADGSDLDLLVTAASDATLFDIAQFEMDMEVLVGTPVSALSVASLDDKRDATILREAVPL